MARRRTVRTQDYGFFCLRILNAEGTKHNDVVWKQPSVTLGRINTKPRKNHPTDFFGIVCNVFCFCCSCCFFDQCMAAKKKTIMTKKQKITIGRQ